MAEDAVGISVKCTVCGSTSTLKRCSRCKGVVYCSREHQLQDWSKHKLSCNVNAPGGGYTHGTEHGVCQQPTRGAEGETNGVKTCGINDTRQTGTVINTNNRVKEKSDDQDTTEENGADDDNTEKSKRENIKSEETNKREEYTPFDERPFSQLLFQKPPSYQNECLAKFIVETMKKNNFCVVDSLFKDSHIDEIVAEIKGLDAKSKLKTGQLAGGRTSEDSSQKVTEAEIRSDRMAWVDSDHDGIPHIARAVDRLDSLFRCFNQYLEGENCFINSRTKMMVTCYPGNGTHYRRHVDNPGRDGRRVTCILYLNKNWDVKTDGGLLRIFPAGSDGHVDIAPLFNRLLFFWSDRRNPHEVHPTYKSRYAMTVWYFDEVERQQAKTEHRHQELLKLQGQIELDEKYRYITEKIYIEQKIQIEARKAVESLSDTELQALAALTRDHPDPREVLGEMGIAASIQDVLVDVLRDVKL